MMTTRTTNLLLVAVVALLTSLIVNVGAQLPGVSVIGSVTNGHCAQFASTLQLQDAGTTCGPNVGTGAAVLGNGGNPSAGTSSATGWIMMGLGPNCRITLNSTGRMFVVWTGDMTNNTAGDYTISTLWYGTGTAPANGVAPPGGASSGGGIAAAVNNANTASVRFTVPMTMIPTGLSLGVSYWVDVALEVNSAVSNGFIYNNTCLMIEF